jgi:hypothetical protein
MLSRGFADNTKFLQICKGLSNSGRGF